MSDASRLSLMMLLVPFKLQRLRVKEFTFTKSRGLVDDVLSALVPGHVVPQMWHNKEIGIIRTWICGVLK